jgi:hypothetical protein
MLAAYSAFLQGAIRAKWLTIGLTLGAFVVAISCRSTCRAAVLSRVRTGPS